MKQWEKRIESAVLYKIIFKQQVEARHELENSVRQ